MCTTLILAGPPGHLLLLGNRDELRTRSPALPPEPGQRALFPIDADALGTWTGVNAHGLALSLLNNYQADAVHAPELPILSRGILTRDLLDARDPGEVASRIQAKPDLLTRVRPFILAAVGAPVGQDARAVLVTWTGVALSCEPLELPALLISSGYDLAGVSTARTEELRDLLDATWSGDADHAYALSERFGSPGVAHTAHTLFMSRDDARTVSHTRVEVASHSARLSYTGVPPHSTLSNAPTHARALERVA